LQLTRLEVGNPSEATESMADLRKSASNHGRSDSGIRMAGGSRLRRLPLSRQ
jgi:hypothetical protein